MRSRAASATLALLALLTMAPTVGDTGGCGRSATELDREAYGYARKREDCRHCTECSLTTARCQRACDPKVAPDLLLPVTCRPLYHDGEVCLRALIAADCDAFSTYVDDLAAVNPSECDFCHVADTAATFDAGWP